ncbi:MarR family winged helix-turn-helix transcriptional regulator [Foetidibacter luteolus]|uniref:MarR family winged helix-turn-helix transcriptional regulator n=1 Tax=Foetidibacter luteolus TaxID=2608880 RepID=UPI00129A8EF9|nr:MarR family winged helix-turn-helix transcriptional regulator [Foetidibacter luteolus]
MKTSECRYASCIYFSASALARKVEKLALESWKPVGLSPSHAYLLLIVLDDAGIQPGALAEQLQLSPSTITRLIEKLEERKLVVRTTEGKVTNVYPTPKAKALLPDMKKCMDEFDKSTCGLLGTTESKAIAAGMSKLADKLP